MPSFRYITQFPACHFQPYSYSSLSLFFRVVTLRKPPNCSPQRFDGRCVRVPGFRLLPPPLPLPRTLLSPSRSLNAGRETCIPRLLVSLALKFCQETGRETSGKMTISVGKRTRRRSKRKKLTDVCVFVCSHWIRACGSHCCHLLGQSRAEA